MPETPIPQHILDVLSKPNPAVMATLAADGRPVTVATWYMLEPDGTILLNFEDARVRLQHLRRDPRIALTALDSENWYVHVSLQGRVGPIVEDVDLRSADRASMHYRGEPYRVRDHARVYTHMMVDRWHAWEAGGPVRS